jgi:uncharacterized protein YjbK
VDIIRFSTGIYKKTIKTTSFGVNIKVLKEGKVTTKPLLSCNFEFKIKDFKIKKIKINLLIRGYRFAYHLFLKLMEVANLTADELKIKRLGESSLNLI